MLSDNSKGISHGSAPSPDLLHARRRGSGPGSPRRRPQRTYDIFAGHWPHQSDVIADRFNAIPKYVASRGEPTLDWAGASPLGDDDLATAVDRLRARHERVSVFGSLELSRQLVERGLFDVLHLLLYPVVLGTGKRLFADGMIPSGLELLDPPVSTAKGAVLLHLGPADRPTTGDMRITD